MEQEFDIQEYMTKGVQTVVTDAVRATLKNPKEAAFMAGFALSTQKASKKRKAAKAQGEHIPPFLIASITSSCNLHCAGCYSRANHACYDEDPAAQEPAHPQEKQLSDEEWDAIFSEAEDLGISFILLAGGEPTLRYDVVKKATGHPSILFPLFTNGTMFGDKYLDLLDKHRNLIPIFSLEGIGKATDERRGAGVYDKVLDAMGRMQERGLIFGTSVTVTTENMKEVYSAQFLENLAGLGCKAVIYVEFVPVTEESSHLAPGEAEREYMAGEIRRLRGEMPEMVFISFPGDEKSSGGCVAAGRGFFHINAHGGAEPCPFSPYSDINVRDTSLKDAMHSRLFQTLREDGTLIDDHAGGCTLYQNRAHVEALLQGARQ
ncbi:MAG: radical SAM protein [Lachnospiraceae bacterium]|nr:radical SAM protein [Lachnospiraceae bacterium]